jgi:nudix-type nucleoside diphosphatase (YffH/AdpP family)
MPADLFLFGTLRHRPLLEAVCACGEEVTLSPARLPGFAVMQAAGGEYPTLVPDPGAQVEGLVARGLSADHRAAIDYYEAAFGYLRRSLTLADGATAEVYFPPEEQAEGQGPFSLDDWVRDWGALSVIAAREVMGYRGDKTPAEVGQMFPMIRARAWSEMNAAKARHGALTLKGRVEITRQSRPYARYFALDELHLRHEQFDGSLSPEMLRAVFRAPDAALVLPYDPARDVVLLVEQIRMGPLARGDAIRWQLEPIAGRLDPGESPEQAARREAREEAGLEIGALHPVAETYCSPGNSSEFFYIFVGIADLPEAAEGVGGLESEQEDIRSHVLPFERLLEFCETMQVGNAPLVLAAYWLAHHRDRLRRAGQDTGK